MRLGASSTATRPAISTKAREASLPGSVTTMGRPSSPLSRRAATRGTCPRSWHTQVVDTNPALVGAEKLVGLAFVAPEPLSR